MDWISRKIVQPLRGKPPSAPAKTQPQKAADLSSKPSDPPVANKEPAPPQGRRKTPVAKPEISDEQRMLETFSVGANGLYVSYILSSLTRRSIDPCRAHL